MTGETDLKQLISSMSPQLHDGDYVFVSVDAADLARIPRGDAICEFQEAEGTTLIVAKSIADAHQLSYDYTAAWITLTVHSSLEAVGLTACFAGELAKHDISCNVVAAYYHDHIFVDKKDAAKAMQTLQQLTHNA